jgi:hypothetical protein
MVLTTNIITSGENVKLRTDVSSDTPKFSPEYPHNWQIIIRTYLDNWRSLTGIRACVVPQHEQAKIPVTLWNYRSRMKHHFSTESISPYHFTLRKRTLAPFCRANSCSLSPLGFPTIGTQHSLPYSGKVT